MVPDSLRTWAAAQLTAPAGRPPLIHGEAAVAAIDGFGLEALRAAVTRALEAGR